MFDGSTSRTFTKEYFNFLEKEETEKQKIKEQKVIDEKKEYIKKQKEIKKLKNLVKKQKPKVKASKKTASLQKINIKPKVANAMTKKKITAKN